MSARTNGKLIARAGRPYLADLDAITGQSVPAGSMSRVRYERADPAVASAYVVYDRPAAEAAEPRRSQS